MPIRELVMSPGERNEVVVDFSDGNPAMLVSGPTSSRQSMMNGGATRASATEGATGSLVGLGDRFEVLQFTVDPGLPAIRESLPRQLNSIIRPTAQSGWPVRRFDLFMRDNRRTRRFGGLPDTIPRCPWALIDSPWTCESLMNECDWGSGSAG